jgi:hypothetical protein
MRGAVAVHGEVAVGATQGAQAQSRSGARYIMVFHALFWFAGEVGLAAWVFWLLYLASCRSMLTILRSQEVNMMANVWSSLTVSVVETFWAVGASVLAAQE